jgi:hypothetical protein
MHIKLTLLSFFIYFSSLAQTDQHCKAFDEGCWTLIGASNGVELYITHKKNTRPGLTNGFNITVYAKIINTNDYSMTAALAPTGPFYYKEATTNILKFVEIPLDKDLDPRQAIVRYQDVFTNLNEIMYSQIKPFKYIKKP